MNILITGGAGFIGSHLVEYLLRENHHLIVVDNFLTGSRRNLAHLQANLNLTIIEHDVIDPLPPDLAKAEVDQIYHLACPASPIHYQSDPINTVKTNVIGTLNMLELAKTKQARFLQASTSEVYGDPKEHPQAETYLGNVNCTGERACYDEGKRCAETICFDYYRQHQLDIRVVRIFNTYGPRMALNDGRVVSNFIIQALSGADIPIHGQGTQTRSFCYVDDLISGLVKMMAVTDFIGPVNLGNPGEFTIIELAEKVLALTKSKSKLAYHDLPPDDPKQRKPDITLARQKLNWQPRTDLEHGLKKTIDYFKQQLSAN